ncbi:DUF2971 domain-containing protein [uncultured Sulfitobacter sp.]|uniref:DUF2971 domain-containing protein n=1 Tax=uncultured Sulfitobacter sp. TaxID=191468 RepID=UPI0025925BB4|nr:DUF2971 domain-containing protein [uncultured Sulfitobacter sp.]
MENENVWNDLFEILHDDIVREDTFPHTAPLLTHYTSMTNLENILTNNELWLSNPLHMNDLEEVRFGVLSGMNIIERHEELAASLGNDDRRKRFSEHLHRTFNDYSNEHVIDLYLVCFSKQEPDDNDGKLSMWRGYGQNGRGAAIVFDASKVKVTEDSPLALAPVQYGTQEQRRSAIERKITDVARLISQSSIPDDYMEHLADVIFKRICLYAIFTKHSGFAEESEWRLVYLKDRDKAATLEPYLSYFNGPNGFEPKLKLPLAPIKGAVDETLDLSSVVHRVIVGPTVSSPLARRSIERMLEKIGKPELKSKIWMSEIPYRDRL